MDPGPCYPKPAPALLSLCCQPVTGSQQSCTGKRSVHGALVREQLAWRRGLQDAQALGRNSTCVETQLPAQVCHKGPGTEGQRCH